MSQICFISSIFYGNEKSTNIIPCVCIHVHFALFYPLSPNDCYSHENASLVSPSIDSVTGREPSCCTWNPVRRTSEEHSRQVRDWLWRGHRKSERGQRGSEVSMASLSFLRFALQYKVFRDFFPSPGLYTYTGVWQITSASLSSGLFFLFKNL